MITFTTTTTTRRFLYFLLLELPKAGPYGPVNGIVVSALTAHFRRSIAFYFSILL